MEKLLKVEEVADILRISKLSVYRMIKEHKLRAVKLPLGREGKLRIPESEITRIIGQLTVGDLIDEEMPTE
jgi:excisionase family DNA binding protein